MNIVRSKQRDALTILTQAGQSMTMSELTAATLANVPKEPV